LKPGQVDEDHRPAFLRYRLTEETRISGSDTPGTVFGRLKLSEHGLLRGGEILRRAPAGPELHRGEQNRPHGRGGSAAIGSAASSQIPFGKHQRRSPTANVQTNNEQFRF